MAREKDRISKMNQRQANSDEQAALAREKYRLSKCNKRKAETADQVALARERNKLAKRRKGDMENVIDQSMKESVKYLHRTKDSENPHKHRAIVCIICNRCIIGTEAICKLTKEQILSHSIMKQP